MDPNEKPIWSKTQAELTVAEALKITCITTVAAMAVSAGVVMAVGAASTVKEKFQARREFRKLRKLNEGNK